MRMWVPEPLFKQATVLIADQRSFSALYLAHALAMVGCTVVGPFASRDDLDEWLSAGHEQLSVAVLALDWLDPAHERISARLTEVNVPYVLVDNAPWRHLASIPVSFSWPYGAFQVLEALQRSALAALTTSRGSDTNSASSASA
jgi:hypothetical protein